MQNAMSNKESFDKNWATKAQNQMDRTIDKGEKSLENGMEKAESMLNQAQSKVSGFFSGVRNLSTDDIRTAATDITHKVRDVSADAIKDPLAFAKRHPVGTAVSAAAVGFLIGMMSNRKRS